MAGSNLRDSTCEGFVRLKFRAAFTGLRESAGESVLTPARPCRSAPFRRPLCKAELGDRTGYSRPRLRLSVYPGYSIKTTVPPEYPTC